MKVAQSCPTLYNPMDCPWHSPGQKTGVGSHFLLKGMLPRLRLVILGKLPDFVCTHIHRLNKQKSLTICFCVFAARKLELCHLIREASCQILSGWHWRARSERWKSNPDLSFGLAADKKVCYTILAV